MTSLGLPGLFDLCHSPGLHPLEPIWSHSIKVRSVHYLSLHRWHVCLLSLSRALHWGNALQWNLSSCIYLHIVVKEGHTSLSIDPYLGHVLHPIPPKKGVGIQEGSLLVMSYALGISSWGAFSLVTLTWGIWTPFSSTVPSFQFKWAADLDAFTSGHLWIKCSLLLQW